MSLKNIGTFNIIDVPDGDTLKIDKAPFPEKSTKASLRLLNIDTEETTNPKFLGPVTDYAKEVKHLTHEWFAKRGNKVELIADNRSLCGYFGRALVYVFAKGEHYQEFAIENGWTPYYSKYGYANKEYHDIFVKAQQKAQKEKKGIWSDELRQRPLDKSRPYDLLLKWWNLRADEIERAKELKQQGKVYLLLNGEDYDIITAKAENKEYVQVFGELERPPSRGGFFKIKVSIDKNFYVYVSKEAKNRDKIIATLEEKYISNTNDIPKSVIKPNYIFLKGHAEMYEKENSKTPELVIYDLDQIGFQDLT